LIEVGFRGWVLGVKGEKIVISMIIPKKTVDISFCTSL